MSVTKTIIVSPSGNFYGSEQVLFDFLRETKNTYVVYAPAGSKFLEKLLRQQKHRMKPFSGTKRLYMEIFLLLFLRKANAVYCNEGGHIRYLKILSRIFGNAKFFVHIRIIEDTSATRIGIIGKNLRLLSISEFLTGMMPKYRESIQTIRDPYLPVNTTLPVRTLNSDQIRAGIIGRVTDTKGLRFIEAFTDFLEKTQSQRVELHFFGDVEWPRKSVSDFVHKAKQYSYVKVQFHGFSDDKDALYNSIDIVLHFSKIEPLGRIFFESLDYGIPFIGFNVGGIGEIAKELSLENCMINDNGNWEQQLYHRITNAQECLPRYRVAREKCMEHFSSREYCNALEEVIVIR